MELRRSGARARLDPIALTLLRVVIGAVMIAHGWQKLQTYSEWRGMVASMGVPAPDVAAALAVIGELGGGIGLLLGLLTPLAALGVLAVMVVAIAKVHAGKGLFAADGGWEFPLLIATVATFFFVHGSGPYGVDAMVRRTRGRRTEEGAPVYRQPIAGPA